MTYILKNISHPLLIICPIKITNGYNLPLVQSLIFLICQAKHLIYHYRFNPIPKSDKARIFISNK